jgi:hypothetical protein
MRPVNIVFQPPVRDNPISWMGIHASQVHKHPEYHLVQRIKRWLRGLAPDDTGMPSCATALGLDLNVNGATLVVIAGHQIDLRHVACECNGKRAALIEFSRDKVLAGTGYLLVVRTTRNVFLGHIVINDTIQPNRRALFQTLYVGQSFTV